MEKKLSKTSLIILMRQLALVLDSDISLFEGLDLIAQKSDDTRIKTLIEKLNQTISQGASLTDAMNENEAYFPAFVRSMLKIGEESGEIVPMLTQVADTYEKELETQAKVRSAITYPSILTILMFGVIFVLIVRVLPMFNDILTSLGGNLPPITAGIMGLSTWMNSGIIWIVLLLVLIVGGLYFYGKTESGKIHFDHLAYKLPILKEIYSAMAAIRFSRNLAILFKSGIPTSRSMHLIASTFDNSYASEKIKASALAVENGESIDEVIEKLDLFPWVLVKLFSVAARTGHMEEMLFKASNTMEKELDNRLERLTTVIEPVLIIILSIIVGIILISVILPIIDIMNAIS